MWYRESMFLELEQQTSEGDGPTWKASCHTIFRVIWEVLFGNSIPFSELSLIQRSTK